MLAHFDVPLGWGELLNRTARETQSDNGLGLAAELAYYFFLALFPALLFVIALAALLPTGDLMVQVVTRLEGVAPPDVVDIIRNQLLQISQSDSMGILTFGAVAALWSSSAAMTAIIGALNRAYDVEDTRPWWRQRLTAILLTIGVALFVLISTVLVVAGPQLVELIAGRAGLSGAFEWTWKIAQWPIACVLVATAIGLIYYFYFAPDGDRQFVWLTPGSVAATALWFVSSLALRLYIVNLGSYNQDLRGDLVE